MKITITVKGIKCETPEKLAYVLCLTSESNKSAWLKAGNMALRAFPSSPKQQFIKQAERILNERIANSAE